MPHLARGQTNNARILALHAVDSSGHLYNPDSVEFRVFDPAGTQVFPASGWEDVTSYGTATGVFPAWDTTAGAGWTVDAAADLGKWSIEWAFLDSDGTTERTWTQEFWVSEADTDFPFWSYVSPNEVRAEGVDASQLSASRLVALLRRVQDYIERACRQPFRPVRAQIKVDGHGAPTLFFSVPIVGIESLIANFGSAALPTSAYRVYSCPALGDDPGWAPGDNRRNPRIALVSELTGRALGAGGIFATVRGAGGRFAAGAQAHTVTGVWGFLERDGATPQLIRDAALRLILANTPLLEVGGSAPASVPAGPITSERTDRHEISYADNSSTSAGPALGSALATSREVEEILHLYRGPIVMGAPANSWLGPTV